MSLPEGFMVPSQLQPIARLNAILVVTSKPAMLRTAATWISRLDKSDTTSTGVKVYHVRYGDARQIAVLLNDIFGSGRQGGAIDSPTRSPTFSASVSSPFTFAPGSGENPLNCSTSIRARVLNADSSSGVHQSLTLPLPS